MLRIFVPLSPNQVHRIEETRSSFGFLEDVFTRLVVQADERHGFYFEINYSIKDRDPLILRDDITEIKSITHCEVTDDTSVVGTGYGNFTCENGTVKISEARGQSGKLEIFIVAKTVGYFNKAIEALRNGELKKDGEELTQFEVLQKRFGVETEKLTSTMSYYYNQVEVEARRADDLSKDVERLQEDKDHLALRLQVLEENFHDIESRNVYLEAELEKELALAKTNNFEYVQLRSQNTTLASGIAVAEQHVSKLEGFIHDVADSIANNKIVPSLTDNPTENYLLFEVHRLKNRNLWQRIWNK